MSDEAKIEVKLVTDPSQMPYGCTVCGGKIYPAWIYAVAADDDIGICADCLRDGSIDSKLAQTAERLEQRADEMRAYTAHVRSLIGRLKVPTFAKWEAAAKREQLIDMARDVREEALDESKPEGPAAA
jgi:hypothetical protein